ncbi:hypothetical protein GCE86_23775 [Micromonospora terminaliae]|uniref:Uncharacterized protein n=1 Tax=Micromonospora terminaliae TaxID=1914461 RepID=A0AAJ2ZKE4_9ACTN|nr:hypothetical protein [Micromonospora terminaliae]NES31402.1 hypothetical protein [Micromonospora terminaliae]QGL49779.1 hypothetical protein GCE86_23775 [Micromonospora terminaliae]
MRFKMSVAVASVVAAIATALPGSASAASGGGSHGAWEPDPQEAFEMPAGARCDFAVRVEPIVDEVRKLTLATYPDGSPRRELFTGALIDRVTNLETGATSTADASGTSLVVYGTDGSMTWYVTGPVLLGFRENAGSLPKGLWIVDGQFVVEFTPTFEKTITMLHGTTHNVCTDVD